MKKSFLVLAALLIVVGVAILTASPSGEHATRQVTGLPWQIDILPDGNSRVSGLTLASSTIGEARERFGNDMELAIIAAPGETGTLEAYYSKATMGVVSGKLVMTAGLDKDTVERLRQRSPKSEYMESSTRKYALSPEDMAFAYAARLAVITFIPTANFGEDVAVSNFGKPTERIRTSEHIEHFLYPAKGLALTLDGDGKELLQYVAPSDFARLRAPLAAATSR